MSSRLRIVVTGLIAQHPRLAGVAWDYLQYPVGLARLGHDVFYLEDSGQWPYNTDGGPGGNDWVARDCKANVDHLHRVLSRFGLGERWAYRFPTTGEWCGLSEGRRHEVISSADLLINVSGTLEYPEHYGEIPHLAYIDSDPMFTQVRLAAEPSELGLSPEETRKEGRFKERVAAHDVHFTFGEVFSPAVPETPYHWRPTRQPILLSEWTPSRQDIGTFTTIMSWTSYTPLQFAGRTYGQKDLEFRKFLYLPQVVPDAGFEVALNGTRHTSWEAPTDQGRTAPRSIGETLSEAGWKVVDAATECGDLDSYRRFIETSKAEWSVAKNGYVIGRSGWFSCRSACYLAAGKPVVVQDTGFSDVIPVGEGLLAFSDLPEAAAAVQEVQSNYDRHANAARSLAEQYFDSGNVLTHLLERALEVPRAKQLEEAPS